MQSLSLFRTKDWLHFLGFPLLGYFASSRGVAVDLVPVLASTALCLAYAYSLNDVMDRHLPRRRLAYPAATLPLLAVCAVLLTGHRRWVLLAAVATWTLYSSPPVRLKSVPIIGTLTNGIGFPLFYLLGLRQLEGRALLFAGMLGCLLVAAQLIHELCHLEQDRREGVRTTVVVFGSRPGRVASVAALGLATVLAALYRPLFAVPVGLAGLLTAVALRHREPAWVRRVTRLAGATVGLVLLAWQLLVPAGAPPG